jgi:hypothetical protein
LDPISVVSMANRYSQTRLSLPKKHVVGCPITTTNLEPNVICCELDGSYDGNDEGGRGGVDFLITRGSTLIQYSTSFFQAISPLEAELKAFHASS